jgi:hypothetical protein
MLFHHDDSDRSVTGGDDTGGDWPQEIWLSAGICLYERPDGNGSLVRSAGKLGG